MHEIQRSLLPFSTNFQTVKVEGCKTLQDVINHTIPYSFEDCKLVVTVNNVVVYDYSYELKENDIIGLNFIPTGGKGGKQAAQIAVVIGAMALAWYAAPLIVGAMGLTTATGALTFGGALLTGAIYTGASFAATMLNATIFALPTQKGKSSSNQQEANVYSLRTNNNANRWGVVPINLGVNRVYPMQCALPYSENIDNKMYLRQLFTWGYGDIELSELKLGDTPLTEYNDYEIAHKLNGNLNEGTELYANDVYQEDLSIQLKKSSGYETRVTQNESDEVVLDFTFQGLTRYDDKGNRNNTGVTFEIQYAPVGTTDWSAGITEKTVSQQVLVGHFAPRMSGLGARVAQRQIAYLCLDIYSGIVTLKVSTGNPVNVNEVLIGIVKNAGSVKEDYRSQYIGKYIKNSTDFAFSFTRDSSTQITVVVNTGTILANGIFTVTDATAKYVRVSQRIVFPYRGQFDVRVRRLTDDSTSDRLINDSYWSAIKSITHINPVLMSDISGTAMRIKASEQLNGSVDNLNAIVSTYVLSYNAQTDDWEYKISSNPADLFRHVLQSPAFAKRLEDNKIDLDKLKEWSVYCDENKLTYNRYIDYEASIDEILNDICAAGVATLSKVDNIYSVIIDNERETIKGLITPRNSWDYEGNILYPEIPHALRIEFRNKDVGYQTDERIVYNDGYDVSNATLFERIQFPSCTNADLAYWYGRRYLATSILQPEVHTFKMDFENLTFNRGDRITLVNDSILVGVGQGRINNLIVDNTDNPTQVLGFSIDDNVTIPNTNNFGVRIRKADGKGYVYKALQTVVGTTNEFMFSEPFDFVDAPGQGSLCAFVEDGKELDLIIKGIKPSSDHTATITAINYAPERFDPISDIPEFESNVTPTWDDIVPEPPELDGEPLTDEEGVLKNLDGTFTACIVFELQNSNAMEVEPVVMFQPVGATTWTEAEYVSRTAEEVRITGLQDGAFYNFLISYRRRDARQQYSLPLEVNNLRFIGGSKPPKDVQEFKVSVINGVGMFTWLENDDFDISHYQMRFTTNIADPSWNTSQIVFERIKGNSVSTPIHEGIYLIKAVDYFGNVSVNETVIRSYDQGAFNNVIEVLEQYPTWGGTKENVVVTPQNNLRLEGDSMSGVYYITPETFDLGDVYQCLLMSTMKIGVASRSGRERLVRSIDQIRNVRYIRSNDEDIDWANKLQMNLSNDGITWTGWKTFTASQHTFRYAKFRLLLETTSETQTPELTELAIIIDMPDRYESGEDVEITDANAGKHVDYELEFRNIPSVNITTQDGAVDDRLEFVEKTTKGFTIKIFNATLNQYVTRSFDYIAAGYGKVVD